LSTLGKAMSYRIISNKKGTVKLPAGDDSLSMLVWLNERYPASGYHIVENYPFKIFKPVFSDSVKQNSK
jgi:hypothetical protein